MLYLVRKLNESIIINNDIEIKVIEVLKNSVKLGIKSPPNTSVLRQEVYIRISEENLKAVENVKPDDLELIKIND